MTLEISSFHDMVTDKAEKQGPRTAEWLFVSFNYTETLGAGHEA